MVMTYGDGLL